MLEPLRAPIGRQHPALGYLKFGLVARDLARELDAVAEAAHELGKAFAGWEEAFAGWEKAWEAERAD